MNSARILNALLKRTKGDIFGNYLLFVDRAKELIVTQDDTLQICAFEYYREGSLTAVDINALFTKEDGTPTQRPDIIMQWFTKQLHDLLAYLYVSDSLNLMVKIVARIGLRPDDVEMKNDLAMMYLVECLAERYSSVRSILEKYIFEGVKEGTARLDPEHLAVLNGTSKNCTGGLMTMGSICFSKRPSAGETFLYMRYGTMLGCMSSVYMQALLSFMREQYGKKGVNITPTSRQNRFSVLLTPTVTTTKSVMTTGADGLQVIERDIPAGSITFIPVGSASFPPEGINVEGVSRLVAWVVVFGVDGKDTTAIIPAGGNSVVLLNGKNAFIVIGEAEVEFRYYSSDRDDICNAAALRVLSLKEYQPPQ